MTRSCRGSGHPGAPVDRNPGAVDRIPPDDRSECLRSRITALAWWAVWEASRRVPEAVAYTGADVIARLLHRVAGPTRARVTRNFSRVVPEADLARTVRAAFRSYARYWVEAFRAADIAADELHARTTITGLHHLDAALDRGRGVVVLLAHHGSWDTAARWGEIHGYHMAAVAEVLRPRALFAKFVALREAIGLEVVPLQRGTTTTARLAEVAQANHLVGLLTDRDLTGKAPVVRFFGEHARLPVGAVVVSRRTGAPIVPITMLQRPGRRWELLVRPAIEVEDLEVAEASQAVAQELQALILTAPEQWHAFQPVWLADLPAHRRGDWQPAQDAAP